jgi:hypothetical protein
MLAARSLRLARVARGTVGRRFASTSSEIIHHSPAEVAPPPPPGVPVDPQR